MKLSFGVLDSEFKNPGVTFLPPLKEFHPRNSRVQIEINTDRIKTKRLEVQIRDVLRIKCARCLDKRFNVLNLLFTNALI